MARRPCDLEFKRYILVSAAITAPSILFSRIFIDMTAFHAVIDQLIALFAVPFIALPIIPKFIGKYDEKPSG